MLEENLTDATRPDDTDRTRTVFVMLLIGTLLLLLAYDYHTLSSALIPVTFTLFAIILIAAAFFLRLSASYTFSSGLLLGIVALSTLILFAEGAPADTGHFWILIFPLLVFYLIELQLALYWIASHALSIAVLCLFMLSGSLESAYGATNMMASIFLYGLIVLTLYANEHIRQKRQKRILASHRELGSILDNMQDTFYRTDTDGAFTMLTPSVYWLLGYQHFELLGKQLFNLYADPSAQRPVIELLKNSGGHINNAEIELRHKNGGTVWILANAHYYYDHAGKLAGTEGTIKDITDQKRYQNALIDLNTQLEMRISDGISALRQKDELMLQQAKMAQMGEMLSMIAHQWRQPLSTISAIISQLRITMQLNSQISPEVLHERLNKIDGHLMLLSQTIDDFRNFFHSDKRKTKTYIDALIDKALDVLHPSIEQQSIEIERSIDLGQPLMTYQNELFQVILNILGNAIDAVSDKKAPRRISIRAALQNGRYVVTVEDNGGGIDEAIKTKIFEPYFSTKALKNGTGLGLYMSKLIIEEHCLGELKAANSAKGALFTIVLPM